MTAEHTEDPTISLTRSNLLRLETAELLTESTLHIHPPSLSPHSNEGYVTGEERAHYEAKWSPAVRRYLHDVNDVLVNVKQCTIGPEVARVEDGYRVPLCSDKFRKHVDCDDSSSSDKWEFLSAESLTLVPVGSFAHVGNAGLTNRHANGNNVPVLDVAVLMDGFVGGKDYLNGRYSDKRNIFATHVAKILSQKKHRSKIGAVHLTPVFGDVRKVGLLLTPPDDTDSTTSNNKTRKHNKKQSKPKIKTRFRIRLLFGMKDGIHTKKAHDDDDEDDSDEEEWNCWIPRSRLFPNRSNNRSEKQADSTVAEGSTPHYTNEIAEDLHFVSTTKLVSSMISSLVGGNVSSATPVSSSFHETLILLKVWALQRGLLRGHDAFTTSTLAILLVHLYRTKGIGRRMGSMQAFTAFMKFWSETDWLGEDTISSSSCVANASNSRAEVVLQRKVLKKAAFVVPEEGRNESQTIDHCEQARLYLKDVCGSSNVPKTLLESYKLHYTSSSSSFTVCNTHHDSPILLDPTMTINYLARLSPSFVRESRAEAHSTLLAIHGHEREEAGGGAFRKLFLQTNRFWTRYDAYMRIPMSSVPKLANRNGKKKNRSKVNRGDTSSHGLNVWGKDLDDLGYNESVCRGLVDVLSLALGDRVNAVRVFSNGNGDIRTSVSEEPTEDIAAKYITDSDQYLAVPIRGNSSRAHVAELSVRPPESPVQDIQKEQYIVIGLRIDPNASRRVVDRGPPAEDVEGSRAFISLWGEKFAQIRRFQDGAIVRAVVWNAPDSIDSRPETMRYFCGDKLMGGIVEKVAQYIVKMHFNDDGAGGSSKTKRVAFELRNLASFIDGASTDKPTLPSDSFLLHRNIISAFDLLSDFLRRNSVTNIDIGKGMKTSKLGLPLSIDEVEPLSPCLRYSSLFPPQPHPFLGAVSNIGSGGKVSGVVDGEPILIQIRFQSNNKWPSSLDAMSTAKCAMLIQLAEGIQKLKDERSTSDDMDVFDGPIDNTPGYLTIGYRGYSWRIIVRADQELRMLKGLKNPNEEAKRLKQALINRHIRGSMHHSLIHAVHTRNPSASAVVRLASRWIASHMLSDMIPHEAIELIVAHIYTDNNDNSKTAMNHSVDAPPSSIMSGFLRFLRLLSSHDWEREPLVVDPQNHISSYDRSFIYSQFETARGPDGKGPAMWIISPADYDGVEEMVGSKVTGFEDDTSQSLAEKRTNKIWYPSITATCPERVVLSRASALAKCSHDHLISCMTSGDCSSKWVAAFQESSASLTSYSALLRVDSSFITDTGCSSTDADCTLLSTTRTSSQIDHIQSPFERSLQKRFSGPKELRKKHFKNLSLVKDTLLEWNPLKSLVSVLRKKYHDYALFFYNEYCPDVIAILWRPNAFAPDNFSAMVSEFKHPVDLHSWKEDTLVIANTDDLMYEIGYTSKDVVTNMKVLDKKYEDTDEPSAKRHNSGHE